MPIEMNLLDNSVDYARKALRDAVDASTDPRSWKYAINNLGQAVELAVKERLRREHRILVFQNIDKPKMSVSFKTAISRLANACEVTLHPSEAGLLTKVVHSRNQFMHQECSIDEANAKVIFAKSMGILRDFYIKQLEVDFVRKIDPGLWLTFVDASGYREELLARVAERVQREGIPNNDLYACEHCTEVTLYYNEILHCESECGTCLMCGHPACMYHCEKCEQWYPNWMLTSVHTMGQVNGAPAILVCERCLDDMEECWTCKRYFPSEEGRYLLLGHDFETQQCPECARTQEDRQWDDD